MDTGKDLSSSSSPAAATSDFSKLTVADQAAAVRAKRLPKQSIIPSIPTDSLPPEKHTTDNNPTIAKLFAQAINKPSSISPHDHPSLGPTAREHHEVSPYDEHHASLPPHHDPHLMNNVAPSRSHQLTRREHQMLAAREETALVRSIQSIHAPDGIQYAYDSKYVLNIIEDIIIRVSSIIPDVKHRIAPDEHRDELHAKNLIEGYTLSNLRDELANPIHKIYEELIRRCSSGGDRHKASEKIFQSLASYAWEAKVVIALAAFTMQYGQVPEFYRTHPLAAFIDAMLDVTSFIIDLSDIFNKHHISHDAEDTISPLLHLSVIPTACYWVIRSIVACSSVLLNLMDMGHDYLTSQVNWELRSLGHKLAQIKGLPKDQWRKCPRILAPFRSHQSEHQMFAAPEETAAVRSILSIHAPGGIQYAYFPISVFNIIEDIFIRVSSIIPAVKHRIAPDEHRDELHAENLMKECTLSNLLDKFVDPVPKICAELIWHFHSDEDGRKASEKIFQSLASYTWEAKVVIALAAFTMQYGEFWLVAELYKRHPLAGSVSLFMEIQEMMANTDIFGPKFKAITDLLDAMLDVTISIIELSEIFNKYNISHDAEDTISPTLHLSVIPTACYWVMRSIVACSSVLLNLMAMGHDYLTPLTNWELGSIGNTLPQIKGLLEDQSRKYLHIVEERRQHDIYATLTKIFGTSHYDNLIGIKALINNKGHPYPLFDGKDGMKKQLEVLKRKHVILFVSHLDIPAPEFKILLKLYHESSILYTETRIGSWIEVVWIPIINHTISSPEDPAIKARYHDIQTKMPWYTVSDPYMIEPGAIRFIREEFKFEDKPILGVLLDPTGRVSNYDAFDMYWIWGFKASPFDEATERELWRDARWSMDLLVDTIDLTVHTWLTSDKYICVFGGNDIDWVRRFTTIAQNVARQLGIPLELLYVGKSTSEEHVRRNNEIIPQENLASVLPEFETWFFWERLKRMWNSLKKHALPTVNDEILQKIVSVLIYDNSDRPWAVFGGGPYGEMAMQEGELMYTVLEEFSTWRGNIDPNNSFVKVLDDVLSGRRPEKICWRVVYPGSSARAPPQIEWPECEKPMRKRLMYLCCTD